MIGKKIRTIIGLSAKWLFLLNYGNRWNIGAPTFAEAILDRIVHNAFRLELEGQSLRKTIAKMDDENPQT